MKKFFFVVVSSTIVTALEAQQPDSVRRFVDSALTIMQHHSVFASQVNWPLVNDSTRQLAATATTYTETLPALRYAFDQLGDKHGWLVMNDKAYRNEKFRPDTTRISSVLEEILAKGPRLYNGVVAKRYAYISIHFFGGQTLEAMNSYAQRIQDSLCNNINSKTRGVIIDLRLNGGGNTFPMLEGIINVLGAGKFTESVNGRGEKEEEQIIGKDMSFTGNDGRLYQLALQRRCGDLSKLPVAVIIGSVTGSAAEQVAIAFTSRRKVALIGERTAGFVSANNGFVLPGQNNALVLAVAYTRNVKGKVFKEDVVPDIEVIGGDNFINREQDTKIQAAVKWLKSQR